MGKWLTPNSSIFSNPPDCRKIELPGDLWLYIQGALELLAKDYNWEEYGSATPEETAQFFMDVLDKFSLTGCETMQWLDVPYTLISETFTMVSGYQITFDRENLPESMQNATGLFLRVILRTVNSNFKIMRVSSLAGQSVDFRRVFTQNVDHYFSFTAPIKDGVKFTINEDSGNSVFWDVRVSGWWN